MASMDDCFQAAALAGESLLRRLRVMRSTMGASPGSAGLDMVREEEAVNTLRGCRRLPVDEFGSITGGMARDARSKKGPRRRGAEIVWCRVAVPAHRVRMRVRIYRNFEQNAKSV